MKNKIPIQGMILVSLLSLLTVFIQIYVSKKNIEYNKYDNIYYEKNKPIKNIIIKNYLKKDMYDKYKWNNIMKHYTIAIVDMNISKEDLISMIKNSEVINFIKFIENHKGTIFIKNNKDIDSISDDLLSKDFFIIRYWNSYRNPPYDYSGGVYILFSYNIYEDTKGFINKYKKFYFSENEIKNGFGNIFYRYIFYHMDISYNERYFYEKNNDKRMEKIKKRKEEHIEIINSSNKYNNFMIISDKGEIMLREKSDGTMRYLF